MFFKTKDTTIQLFRNIAILLFVFLSSCKETPNLTHSKSTPAQKGETSELEKLDSVALPELQHLFPTDESDESLVILDKNGVEIGKRFLNGDGRISREIRTTPDGETQSEFAYDGGGHLLHRSDTNETHLVTKTFFLRNKKGKLLSTKTVYPDGKVERQ